MGACRYGISLLVIRQELTIVIDFCNSSRERIFSLCYCY